MSPRKLTEDDKQEILQQYRNSEATTSTLAKSFEVSSSTISRFLKNRLSSAEYEDLIQQKRLARTPRGEKSSDKTSTKKKKTKAKSKKAELAKKVQEPLLEEAVAEVVAEPELPQEPKPTLTRRRRRSTVPEPEPVTSAVDTLEENEPETPPAKLILDRRTSNDSEDIPKSERLILRSERIEPEEEDEDDAVDLITLKEMLGEDLEDINDEEDEEDEDWDEDETVSYPERGSISNIQILPLSQASFPRTCYLVIDRSAELIVKPLEDFADLGTIPDAEVRQRTLPVFDNHHIAKRFSHRRERVIKVPDGRMIQKTSHHLQVKGITRLLIDGQIYSLSN